MAEYRVDSGQESPFTYFVMTEPMWTGRYLCEGYGVAVQGPAGRAEAHHLTLRPRVVQDLLDGLIDRQVPPEGLERFLAEFSLS